MKNRCQWPAVRNLVFFIKQNQNKPDALHVREVEWSVCVHFLNVFVLSLVKPVSSHAHVDLFDILG